MDDVAVLDAQLVEQRAAANGGQAVSIDLSPAPLWGTTRTWVASLSMFSMASSRRERSTVKLSPSRWTSPSSDPLPALALGLPLFSDMSRYSISPLFRRITTLFFSMLWMTPSPNSEYPMHLLRIGPARVLFVPGEPFVEFQLYVQSLIPDAFIAVAANCSDNFLYIPTAEAFAQGGYEVESFRWCTREFEIRFQDTVRALVL